MSTTRLQVTGLPGAPQSFTAKGTEPGTSPRPDPTGRFTALTVMGVSGVVRSFSAKAGETSATKTASDSIRLSIAEDPVGSVSIDGWELARLRVTEAANVSKSLLVPRTDTLSIRVVETYTLNKSGTTLKSSTDTASLSVTETGAANDLLYGTDTLSVSVSETGAISGTSTQKSATDTASLTLDEGSAVFASESIQVSSTDSVRIGVTESSVVIPSTLYRRVSINLEWPEWKISLRLK